MKQFIRLLAVFLALWCMPEAKGISPWAYDYNGTQDTVYVQYGQQNIYLELLDNADQKYSEAWQNVAKVMLPPSDPYPFLKGKVYIPETINYKNETYHVIGLDSVYTTKNYGVTTLLDLPYEMTFFGDYAFDGKEEGRGSFEELTFPPALRYVGESAFHNLPDLTLVRSLSPLPPVCKSSTGRLLTIGDELMEGEYGPFEGTEDHCTLEIPRGMGYFYENHPAFQNFPTARMAMYCPGLESPLVCLGPGWDWHTLGMVK